MEKLKIKVMPNVILGTLIDDSKTESGIVIPETAKKANLPRVKILAVGEGVQCVKEGDIAHVLPHDVSVAVFSINNVKMIKLYPDEIIGVDYETS